MGLEVAGEEEAGGVEGEKFPEAVEGTLAWRWPPREPRRST